MPNSYSQSGQAPCPSCGQDVPFEVWLIVDVAERPDLLARAREGNLNAVKCPYCGHEGQVGAPLLIHDSGQQRLLLAIPSGLTDEQAGEINAQLVGRLLSTLGDEPRPDYLGQTQVVPLVVLPAVLADDPEAALRQLAEQAAAEMERLRQENPEAYQQLAEAAQQPMPPLRQVIQEFIQAASWADSQRILEQYPELLSDEADALLESLAQAQENSQARQVVEMHRTLLRRCREVGIAQAFAEKTLPPEVLERATADGIPPEQLLETAHATAQMPPELRAALAELAATGAEIRSPEDLERLLAERPDLQAKLEAAARTRGGLEVPSEFRTDIQQAKESEQRYLQSGDHAVLDVALAAWEQILHHPAFTTAPERFQPAVWSDAGGAFLRRYWASGHTNDLDRALALWQQAVQGTPPDSPDLPGYLNNLGTGLRARYAHTGSLEDLAEANRVYQQAVQGTPPDSPDLPGYLSNLGNGLSDRYARTGDLEDLAEAIRVYQQAVQGTSPDSPDLPSRLNNLGTGLSDRYAHTGNLEDLAEAIRVYQQAVQGTSPDSPDLPGYLNNLGNGLSAHYARTGNREDLAEANRVYQQAVQGTPPDSPDALAMP